MQTRLWGCRVPWALARAPHSASSGMSRHIARIWTKCWSGDVMATFQRSLGNNTHSTCVPQGNYSFFEEPIKWVFPHFPVMPYGEYRFRLSTGLPGKPARVCLCSHCIVLPKVWRHPQDLQSVTSPFRGSTTNCAAAMQRHQGMLDFGLMLQSGSFSDPDLTWRPYWHFPIAIHVLQGAPHAVETSQRTRLDLPPQFFAHCIGGQSVYVRENVKAMELGANIGDGGPKGSIQIFSPWNSSIK